MFFFVWAAKGGSGVTVTSVCLAAAVGRRSSAGALIVDLGGDVPLACGIAMPRWGVTDWLSSTDGSPAALSRLATEADGVAVLALGSSAAWDDRRVDDLVTVLRDDGRHVVVDAGAAPARDDRRPLAALRHRLLTESDRSVLVTRQCYLGVRRAVAVDERIDALVVVREVGRRLEPDDIAASLAVDRVVTVDYDPVLARAVDAGRLLGRGSRQLDRALRRVA